MKIRQGVFLRACSNMSRTRLAPTPTNISTKSEPLMLKNAASASPAMALASKRFAGAGRADHQDALGNASAEALKFLRVLEEFDQFGNFLLGFLDAGDVLEGDLVAVLVQHPGLAFAEAHGAFAGHLDLADEEKWVKYAFGTTNGLCSLVACLASSSVIIPADRRQRHRGLLPRLIVTRGDLVRLQIW
jgi:hypothetical protein